MNKLFKLVGVLTALGGGLLGIAMLNGGAEAVFVILSSILTGCLFYSVGSLLERVAYLERKLGTSKAAEQASNAELPQKQCPKCGKKYDFDYPSCPHCGN